MKHFIFVAALAMALAACHTQNGEKDLAADNSASDHINGIYHWKTYWDPTQEELAFIKKHKVGKLYMRFFDVVEGDFGSPEPVATLSGYLYDRRLNGMNVEIVPTVFITLDALRNAISPDDLAYKIHTRINDMIAGNSIRGVKEIQVDCDWTESTEQTFFEFCRLLAHRVHADNRQLSATIRLHQLNRENPPVDRGMLMVYNVGSLKSYDETNSILRPEIVSQYLENAPQYPLPLDVVYPMFSWCVHFSDGQFKRLYHLRNHPDSCPNLEKIGKNIYKVTEQDFYKNFNIGDILRYEDVQYQDLIATKKIVDEYLGRSNETCALYHLDENCIKSLTQEQISEIYE